MVQLEDNTRFYQLAFGRSPVHAGQLNDVLDHAKRAFDRLPDSSFIPPRNRLYRSSNRHFQWDEDRSQKQFPDTVRPQVHFLKFAALI
jgi:hypothetical protein